MKKLYLLSLLGIIPAAMSAQSAVDAYRLSQNDMKGTARFMSMAGAFGALGGDLSSLSQNPAGIGVYRSNELGFTLNLDCQKSTSESTGFKTSMNQTKFLLNNIGGVATLRLGSASVPNLNFGFTYNKAASFNARYSGGINLHNSMTNYIAGIANDAGITVADVESTDYFNPYNPNDGGIEAPWLTILGYDSYLINPQGDPDSPHWTGQWADPTSGTGGFDVETKGGIDDYNIAIGGNIANVVYWGMNFDLVTIDYTMNAVWQENLLNASLDYGKGELMADSRWSMSNYYRAKGNGFNYQLGVIVKPIQELRIGLAFHTPTWYNITENYLARTNFTGPNGTQQQAVTDDGYVGENYYKFRSPWKVIASLAGVIGQKFIISADYEWTGYNNMKFSPDNGGGGYYDDWGWDWGWDYSASMTRAGYGQYDPYAETNKDIKSYYQSTNTFRIGAEYRVTPQFSVRAGYSYVSSPVKERAKNNQEIIYTSGTLPNYKFDNSTNYITCGLGYRFSSFYIDLAYVYKHQSSEYHAYTPDPQTPSIPSPTSKLSLSNSQVVMSMGFKF